MLSKTAAAPALSRFAENRLLAGISEERLHQLTSNIEILELESGDVIFEEGDPGDSLYLVGSGAVKISKAGRGGQQETLGFISPGNFFGEMSLIDGQPRSAQASAAERSVLGKLDEQAFQEILSVAPGHVQMNFLRSVVERLRGVNSHFISEMMRTERLSLVGTMANSIIHDLKSPIGVIRCCSEMLANKISHPDCAQFTGIIDKALEGMMGMTQELLDFARGNTTVDLHPLPIARLVRDFEQQALRLLPSHIQLACDIRADGVVDVDERRFLRALGNLTKNAMEAMPGGGLLTFFVVQSADEVTFTVSDTGCGIPPEILGKSSSLSSPRKAERHRTRHGHRQVRHRCAQGRVSIESTVGAGTQIQIRLPLARL
jgi:signal transduction histidine kinase